MDNPSVEEMLCVLYQDIQHQKRTIENIQVQVDALSKQANAINGVASLLLQDLGWIRAHLVEKLNTAASAAPTPPPIPHEDGIPWDKREDESIPEAIFFKKDNRFRIPNNTDEA